MEANKTNYEFETKVMRLQRIASIDASRFNLRGVKIETDTKLAVATNGHSLAVTRIGEQTTVTTPMIVHFTKDKPAKRALQFGQVAYHSETKQDLMDDGKNGKIEIVDGDFPQWRQVLPQPTKHIVVGLNAELLLDLALALNADAKKPYVYLSIDPEMTGAPMYVTTDATGHNGAGVLMPVVKGKDFADPADVIQALAKQG